MKALPLVGNSGPVLLQRETFAAYIQKIYDLSKEAKYVGFYDFHQPVIMIRDPELIRSITVKNFDHFVNHRTLVDPDVDALFGGNLFSLKDNKWREMRNLLSPAFTSSKMKAMFKLMSNCAENFSNYLASQAEKEELEVDSKDIFTRYTNDVIATCAFGISVDSMKNRENEFYTLGRKATTFTTFTLVKFMLAMRLPWLAKIFNMKILGSRFEQFFLELVKETVETRDREGISRPDMIQLMMDSRNIKSGEGPQLTLVEMTSQAMVFFFGGFETVSTLMCFLAHMISIHPEVQKKIHDEIDDVLERCQGEVTYEAINSMPYLEAVMYETMRLYPVLPAVDRVCSQEFELPPALPGKKPVILKPGENVVLPVYALHRNPHYFSDPDNFSPERFMEDPKGMLNNPAFLPFGVGPRMCIGNRFALLETKALIFHIMTKCSLQPGKKMILPLELSTKLAAMTAKGGFWLKLTPRNEGKVKNL
uniref:Cytochrome P450 n=1 Tax=Bracon brevicornis TaxID=1563983 RepID=A0A6V7M0G0_9HYME